MSRDKCGGCRYAARVNVGADGEMLYACTYVAVHGTRRPCPPGEACTVYERIFQLMSTKGTLLATGMATSVKKGRNTMDRLTEKSEDGVNVLACNPRCSKVQTTKVFGLTAERVHELAAAEAAGRLIILPCKAGDTVWVLTKKGSINSYEIGGAIIDPNNIWMDAKEIGGISGGGLLNCLQFGIDVFLTREEAEAALGRDDNG